MGKLPWLALCIGIALGGIGVLAWIDSRTDKPAPTGSPNAVQEPGVTSQQTISPTAPDLDGVNARLAQLESNQVTLLQVVSELRESLARLEEADDQRAGLPDPSYSEYLPADEYGQQDYAAIQAEGDRMQTEFLEPVSSAFWREEIDDIWAAETEQFAWQALGGQAGDGESQGASLNSFSCRASLCEATFQAQNQRQLIAFQIRMAKMLSTKLPAVRFGVPEDHGNTIQMRAYLARTSDRFALVN